MNILLVEDHALVREAVGTLVSRSLDCQILVSVSDVGEALCQIEFHRMSPFDLILLDLGLPGISGMEAICALRKACPATLLVVLTAADDKDTAIDSLRHGAVGFLPKTLSASAFVSALERVLDGGIYLPSSNEFNQRFERLPESQPGTASQPLEGFALSGRQQETLRMLMGGCSNKRIARGLGITESTAKAHVSAILRALNVATRAQAVALVVQRRVG